MDTYEMVEDDQALPLLSLFDTTPEHFAFRDPIPQQIHARRARMSDVLIFDILLTSGNIRTPSALYPPKDVAGLQRLLHAIEESTYDLLKKDGLVYFLLKWHRDDRATNFHLQRSIPPQFVALADAYWCLDCGMDVPRAITLLADARLNRDYTSKILQAISLTHNPNPLIRRYVRTARPILSEPGDIDTYAIALADSNLLEAWHFQQTFPEGASRSRLLNKLLRWCLTPKPRPEPLKQLLGYSFTPYEQSLVHAFAVRPPSDLPAASITAIQDLVCLRLVLVGQTVTAVKLNRQFPVGTTSESRRAAQDRKQHMLDEAVAVLPEAERRQLELELERASQNPDLSTSTSGNSDQWSNADVSMSMSWEHIGPVPTKANGSASKTGRKSDAFSHNPATPIPKKSGAPRFGGSISSLANVSSASPSFVLGRSQPSPQTNNITPPIASSSRVRSLAAKFQNTPSDRPTESIYDTVGSANKQRNAFFEPSISAGSKRALPQDSTRLLNSSTTSSTRLGDTSTASASAVVRELMRDEEEGDVEMEPSEESQAEPETQAEPERKEPQKAPSPKGPSQGNRSFAEAEEDEDPRELSFSLFSSVNSTAPRPKAARSETEAKMPPGAFYADDDDDAEAAISHPPPPPSRPRRSEVKKPAEPSGSTGRRQSQAQEKPPARPARARKSEKPVRRSIPGSLMMDDDEEDEAQQEEEDIVPPLPPISTSSSNPSRRQPGRKSRTSKSEDGDSVRDSGRPTRRSSRLSVVSVSSRGSSSPEPPASPVKRRSTRTSVATPKKKAAAKQR
ncbi:nuclear pore complex assembly-domain-containing protein [Cristinia sonorae]|uniref:Nuclear pore complex assembly-domain-containing protein n=1 Tax=Cristinia sonorae TaxID=1940300 RepID=A0A8K0UU20_9AGAR|nr:nuclear pore complex assembly-domain-containing protein [Cristinia sonorae]